MNRQLRLVVLFFVFASGCSSLSQMPKKAWDSASQMPKKAWNSSVETTRKIWGSSTKALEEARQNGEVLVKNYACPWSDCFDKVVKIAELKELKVFMKDQKKKLIIVMNVPGQIDTTEVGIFLSEPATSQTKVEVVSLSPEAQAKTAGIIFSNLAKSFNEVK